MKKVTAYINTIRVHWLVEELEAIGIQEIMVIEFFSPLSKISRLQLLCGDEHVEAVRSIIHQIGTTGSSCDHCVLVSDYFPNSLQPIGKRISPLED